MFCYLSLLLLIKSPNHMPTTIFSVSMCLLFVENSNKKSSNWKATINRFSLLFVYSVLSFVYLFCNANAHPCFIKKNQLKKHISTSSILVFFCTYYFRLVFYHFFWLFHFVTANSDFITFLLLLTNRTISGYYLSIGFLKIFFSSIYRLEKWREMKKERIELSTIITAVHAIIPY